MVKIEMLITGFKCNIFSSKLVLNQNVQNETRQLPAGPTITVIIFPFTILVYFLLHVCRLFGVFEYLACIYCLLSCVWTIDLWALTSIDVCLYIHFIYKYTVQKMNRTSRISPYPVRRQVAELLLYAGNAAQWSNAHVDLLFCFCPECQRQTPRDWPGSMFTSGAWFGFPPCNQWKKSTQVFHSLRASMCLFL